MLATGACDFELPESLYDRDYPGHYQRQIKRVSVTVVYTSPGKNDNVMCTFTLVKNRVRMNTNLNIGGGDPYAENPAGNDTTLRLPVRRGAVGLSPARRRTIRVCSKTRSTTRSPTRATCRSRARARSATGTWRLPPNNQIDIAAVSDVLIHVLYTALDGGPDFRKAAAWAATQPQFATKLFSAANDFSAPSALPSRIPTR